MAEKRKLLAEIERCFKVVDQEVILFEEAMEKMYGANSDNQKDKYQDDLKKEFKEIQRLRDQVKIWQERSASARRLVHRVLHGAVPGGEEWGGRDRDARVASDAHQHRRQGEEHPRGGRSGRRRSHPVQDRHAPPLRDPPRNFPDIETDGNTAECSRSSIRCGQSITSVKNSIPTSVVSPSSITSEGARESERDEKGLNALVN